MVTNALMRRIALLERQVANLQKQSIRSEISGITEAVQTNTLSNLPVANTAGDLLLITDSLNGSLYFDTGTEQRHHNQLFIINGLLPNDVPDGSMGVRIDAIPTGQFFIRIAGSWRRFGTGV